MYAKFNQLIVIISFISLQGSLIPSAEAIRGAQALRRIVRPITSQGNPGSFLRRNTTSLLQKISFRKQFQVASKTAALPTTPAAAKSDTRTLSETKNRRSFSKLNPLNRLSLFKGISFNPARRPTQNKLAGSDTGELWTVREKRGWIARTLLGKSKYRDHTVSVIRDSTGKIGSIASMDPSRNPLRRLHIGKFRLAPSFDLKAVQGRDGSTAWVDNRLLNQSKKNKQIRGALGELMDGRLSKHNGEWQVGPRNGNVLARALMAVRRAAKGPEYIKPVKYDLASLERFQAQQKNSPNADVGEVIGEAF